MWVASAVSFSQQCPWHRGLAQPGISSPVPEVLQALSSSPSSAAKLSHSSSLPLQMFKGPDQDIEYIYTAPSSAVCGVSLDTSGKKEYLIAGGVPRARGT